jgi:hypothetical protein
MLAFVDVLCGESLLALLVLGLLFDFEGDVLYLKEDLL